MGLKRALRTLLDPDLRLRAQIERQRRRAVERRAMGLNVPGVLGTLDEGRIEALRAANANTEYFSAKYLDIEKWLPTNIRRVLAIGLDLMPPSRVLDLGSGAGYFLHICKQLGHDPVGLDVPADYVAWYAQLFELYGVPRILSYIKPFEPLPDLGAPFDVVTGFMVCFNAPKGPQPWGAAEWTFFLDDLQTRMKPGGIVWFELNPAADGSHYTPELAEFFRARGAIVDGKSLVWGIPEPRYNVLVEIARIQTAEMRKRYGPPPQEGELLAARG